MIFLGTMVHSFSGRRMMRSASAAGSTPSTTGGWRVLSGDEIGGILGDWRLTFDGSGPDRLVATTIVSSSLLSKIAAEHGVVHLETLTGFKWLARAAIERPHLRPVYAYEEALGSCVGGVVLTAAWLRDFWSYDARTDEHAVRERSVREAAGEA